MTQRTDGDWSYTHESLGGHGEDGVIPPDVLRRVAHDLEDQEWTFAKTMPKNPHWYTVRKRWANDDAFVDTVTQMRRYGYREHFRGYPYTMLNINGFKYWTMSAAINAPSGEPYTIIINRKPVDAGLALYDPMAPSYDDAFSDDESEAENREVGEMVGPLTGLDVLDVGCGTGLLLDVHHAESSEPLSYRGIDPSGAMLDRLVSKHPSYKGSITQAGLEEYVPEDGRLFDLVVSAFGSPAYIDRAHLEHIPTLVKPGGRWFLMFLREGYRPVAYERTGIELPYRDGVHADVPGERIPWHNYVIVQGVNGEALPG